MVNKQLFLIVILVLTGGITGCAGIPKVYLRDCRLVYGNERGFYSVIEKKNDAFLSLGQSVPRSEHPVRIGKTYHVSYDMMWNYISENIEKLKGKIIVEDKQGGIIVFQYNSKGRMPDSIGLFKMNFIEWKTYFNIYVKKIDKDTTRVNAIYFIPLLYSSDARDKKRYNWMSPGYIDSFLRSGDKGIEFIDYADVIFFTKLDKLIGGKGKER